MSDGVGGSGYYKAIPKRGISRCTPANAKAATQYWRFVSFSATYEISVDVSFFPGS